MMEFVAFVGSAAGAILLINGIFDGDPEDLLLGMAVLILTFVALFFRPL